MIGELGITLATMALPSVSFVHFMVVYGAEDLSEEGPTT